MSAFSAFQVVKPGHRGLNAIRTPLDGTPGNKPGIRSHLSVLLPESTTLPTTAGRHEAFHDRNDFLGRARPRRDQTL